MRGSSADRVRVTGLLAAWLVTGALGCGGEEDLAIIWPELSDSTRTLFITVADGPDLYVEARPASDLSPFRFPLPDRDPSSLAIVLVESNTTLEDLGVAAGSLPASQSGVCFARSIPVGGAIHRLGLEAKTWSPATELGSELENFRFLAACPCVDLHLERAYELPFVAPPDGRIAATVRQDEWFGFTQQGTVRIDLAETSTSVDVLGEVIPAASSVFEAWTDASDDMWIVAKENVHRWDGRSPSELIVESAPGQEDDHAGAHGASQARGYELYMALDDGRVLRQTELQSEEIHDGSRLLKDPSQAGTVLMLEPGLAAFAVHDDSAVGRYDHGVVTAQTGPGAIVAMAPTASGIVVGGRYSQLWLMDIESLGYTELQDLAGKPAVGRDEIEGMVPYRSGALALSRDGFVVQYVPDLGLCPPAVTTGFTEVRSLSRRGDEVLLAGTSRAGAYRVEVWAPR